MEIKKILKLGLNKIKELNMNSKRVKAGSIDLLMSVVIQAVLSLVFIVRPVIEMLPPKVQ